MYYPTEELLDLVMFVVHNDESFVDTFLSKYGEIIDWHGISFSGNDVYLNVILDCGQSIAVRIDAEEFKEWMRSVVVNK